MSSTGSARSLQFVGITYQVPPLKAPQHVHCRCPGAALRNPAVVLQRRRLRSTDLIRTAAKKKIAVEDPPVVAANIRQDLLPELIVFDLVSTQRWFRSSSGLSVTEGCSIVRVTDAYRNTRHAALCIFITLTGQHRVDAGAVPAAKGA
jgi:hypothetical protein